MVSKLRFHVRRNAVGSIAFFFAITGVAYTVGLSVPTLAGAEWTTPFDLSAAGQDAIEPQVAVDPDGDAVFNWRRFDGANYRVQARARSATGTLSAVQTLSGSGGDAFNPQVAVDASGDAVFTWSRYDGANSRVQTRALSATGTLSAVQTLSDPSKDAVAPQVAVDAGGDAVFAWQQRSDPGADFRVQTRARSAAGALSTAETLSGSGDAENPQVAVRRKTGMAVFTWTRWDQAGGNPRVEARARSAAGTLSTVQRLSDSGGNAFNPQVGVDNAGDAVFTWNRFDGADYRVQTRTRSATGTLSAVQTLSSSGQGGFAPQVGVDNAGDAVFTWVRFDGANYRVQARSRSATGTLSAVQSVSNPGRDAGDPQVAVEPGGQAMFTWSRSDGTHNLVEARSRSAAGVLRPLTILSDPRRPARTPQVAVGANGDAAVTWFRSDGANYRIQASAGP